VANTNGLVIRVGERGFRTEIQVGGHTLIADEPVALGGTDEGPTPYDYMAAALGSCTAMTLRMYADRRGWPLEGVTVRMRHGRVHEKDCEDCATQAVGIHQLEREVELDGPLTDEQRAGLLRIADRCPVAQSLASGIRVVPAQAAPRDGDVAPPPAA
jgi:putative redox protein